MTEHAAIMSLAHTHKTVMKCLKPAQEQQEGEDRSTVLASCAAVLRIAMPTEDEERAKAKKQKRTRIAQKIATPMLLRSNQTPRLGEKERWKRSWREREAKSGRQMNVTERRRG